MLLLCANRSFLPSPSLLLFLLLTKPAVGEGLPVGNFANSVFWTESLTRAKLGKVTGDAAIAARFLTGPQSDFDSSGNFDRFRLPLPSIVVCQAAIHRVCYCLYRLRPLVSHSAPGVWPEVANKFGFVCLRTFGGDFRDFLEQIEFDEQRPRRVWSSIREENGWHWDLPRCMECMGAWRIEVVFIVPSVSPGGTEEESFEHWGRVSPCDQKVVQCYLWIRTWKWYGCCLYERPARDGRRGKSVRDRVKRRKKIISGGNKLDRSRGGYPKQLSVVKMWIGK